MASKKSKVPNPAYVPPEKTKKPRKEIDYRGFEMPEVTGWEFPDFADTGLHSKILFKGGLPDNIHNIDLYNSGKYSDFTLECNGREFKVHKAVVW